MALLHSGAERRACSLELRLLDGTVVHDGTVVELTRREAELLAALALVERRLTSDVLSDLLWPDAVGARGRNSLKVHVSRLRARLAPALVVRFTDETYRLDDGVAVDVRLFEQAIAAAALVVTGQRLPAAHCDALLRAASKLAGGFPSALAGIDWIAPFEARLGELHRDGMLLLARDAQVRGDVEALLIHTKRMLACDPCDEVACDWAVGAALATGDRIGALRIYRLHERALAEELGASPAARLRATVLAATA